MTFVLCYSVACLIIVHRLSVLIVLLGILCQVRLDFEKSCHEYPAEAEFEDALTLARSVMAPVPYTLNGMLED